MLLFDPVRTKVTTWISQFFFRERYEFETSVQALRREIAHALQLTDLTRLLMGGLERSRRVTHAALYLADADGRGYNLQGHVGPEPAARVEMAPARPLLDRLRREGTVTIEAAERELEEQRDLGEHRDPTSHDRTVATDPVAMIRKPVPRPASCPPHQGRCGTIPLAPRRAGKPRRP